MAYKQYYTVPQGQTWLLKKREELGFRALKDTEALCYGIGAMGASAILAEDLASFDKRLYLIATVPGKTKEPTQLQDQISDQEKREIRDIPAFFEGTELYHRGDEYKQVFPKGKVPPSSQDILLTSPVVLSHKLESLGGLARVDVPHFSSAYSTAELSELFKSLEMTLKNTTPPLTTPLALIISTGGHAITVGYHPQGFKNQHPWVLIDANHLPTKYIDDVSSLVTEVQQSAFANEKTKTTVIASQIYITPGRCKLWISSESGTSTIDEIPENTILLQKVNGELLLNWQEEGHLKTIKIESNADKIMLTSISDLFSKMKEGIKREEISDARYASLIDQITISYGIPRPREKEYQKAIDKWQNNEDWKKINTPTEENVNLVNADGYSQLFLAAKSGDVDRVKQLLSCGANPNLVTKDKNISVLFVAAQNGNTEVVKLLLAKGANPNLVEKVNGASALHMAVQGGYTEIVKLLLANSALSNLTTKDNLSALHVAAIKGHTEIVKLLLAEGADPNLVMKEGSSALHIAASYGNAEIVKLLLAKGANPNLTTDKNLSALHLAIENGHIGIVKILLTHRAKTDIALKAHWAKQADIESHEWENLISQRIDEISSYLLKAKRFPDEITNGYINALKTNNHEELKNYKTHIERLIGILEFVDKSFKFKSDLEFHNMLIALEFLEQNKSLESNIINNLFLHSDHSISFAKCMLILKNNADAMEFYSKLTSPTIDSDSAIDKILIDVGNHIDESYAEAFVKLNKADLLSDAFVAYLHKVSKSNHTNISDEADKMIALKNTLGDKFEIIKNYIDAFDPPDLFRKDDIGFAMHFELLQILFQNERDANNDDFFEIARSLADSSLAYEKILLKGISVLKGNKSLTFANYEILKNLLDQNLQEHTNPAETQQDLLIKVIDKIIQATNAMDPNKANEFKSLVNNLSQEVTYQRALVHIINDNVANDNNGINVYKIKGQVDDRVANLNKIESKKEF